MRRVPGLDAARTQVQRSTHCRPSNHIDDVFFIKSTHSKQRAEQDWGLTHFLEGRMDASFGTTPLAMLKAIRLMETGLVDPEAIITHRFALADIHEAFRTMGQRDRNKVVIRP